MTQAGYHVVMETLVTIWWRDESWRDVPRQFEDKSTLTIPKNHVPQGDALGPVVVIPLLEYPPTPTVSVKDLVKGNWSRDAVCFQGD